MRCIDVMSVKPVDIVEPIQTQILSSKRCDGFIKMLVRRKPILGMIIVRNFFHAWKWHRIWSKDFSPVSWNTATQVWSMVKWMNRTLVKLDQSLGKTQSYMLSQSVGRAQKRFILSNPLPQSSEVIINSRLVRFLRRWLVCMRRVMKFDGRGTFVDNTSIHWRLEVK